INTDNLLGRKRKESSSNENSLPKLLNIEKIEKEDTNKTELLEEFKVNLLKYNLLCDGKKIENISEENNHSTLIKNFISKKIKNLLQTGDLEDKINLYKSIHDNDVVTGFLNFQKNQKKTCGLDDLS